MSINKPQESCACEETTLQLVEKDASSNEEKIKSLLDKTDLMIAKCKARKKNKKKQKIA